MAGCRVVDEHAQATVAENIVTMKVFTYDMGRACFGVTVGPRAP